MNVAMLDSLDLIPIGDLVSRYGVAPQSLRNWEQQGLIPPARRTPGGHRRYGAEHVAALDRLLGVRAPLRRAMAGAPVLPAVPGAGASLTATLPAMALARV